MFGKHFKCINNNIKRLQRAVGSKCLKVKLFNPHVVFALLQLSMCKGSIKAMGSRNHSLFSYECQLYNANYSKQKKNLLLCKKKNF